MKKLRLLLALFVASFCSVQSAWADRVAPELPAAQALVSGTSYYLYNVMENKFACRSTTSTYYVGLGTYGEGVTITATANEGEYTIKWISDNRNWYAYDTYVSTTSNNYCNYFTIAESSKGYSIQRSPRNTNYYKADEYIGFNGHNGDRLNPSLAEGSVHWQLISVEDAEYYFAKHKLYTYLEVADQCNFYITQYDLIYNNPNSTTAELNQAQLTLENALNLSQNYVSPDWTEYPILFQNKTENKWTLSYNGKFQWTVSKTTSAAFEATSTLVGTVNVDADATFVYSYSGNYYSTMRVYLDGELTQIIKPNQSSNKERRYFIEIPAGKHDISWTCLFSDATTNTHGSTHYLSNIGVVNTPTITPATTTIEGQLGTEVLKLVDPVSSVKKIVINGVIGADDWTTIGLMVNAFSIDMSGATTTAPLPARLLTGDKCPFLHNVKLPQGLTAIGDNAFINSNVENELVFPESLTSIGEYAFYGSKLEGAYMTDGITEIGRSAFSNCYYLENVTYPSTASSIPYNCFTQNYNLRTFTIPEGVRVINNRAFSECNQFNPRFPSTITRIHSYAFEKTATDSLFINENVTVNEYAFKDCYNLVYAEWPTTFADATIGGSQGNYVNQVVEYCTKLNKVMLKSPTVVIHGNGAIDFFYELGIPLNSVTLLVPDFLVSAYKLDPYWYQCNVQGFNSSEITDWNITKSLVLNAGQRMGGTPNLRVTSQGGITVNGDDTQNIGNLSINYSPISYSWIDNNYSYTVAQQWGMMLGNSNNVNITGELSEVLRTQEKTWYFLTLPFDTKVSDITTSSNESGAATSFAIRYYDGATRATNGSGGNWKNYTADDIIPAGTGFIYQTAKAASSKFVAQNNASKQNILSNNEFAKALEAHPSAVTANKGWNLVGNPWQTYYNIHKLNFTAPITVWDMSNKKYEAYSIIDDDYAIKPLEAIFVQCPDEVNSISFPIDGRQLTNVIESQNGARAAQAAERKLVDVVLSDGEMKDKTRFVLNPQASLAYEVSCDASKFMSMDGNVPQIWTVEQGTQMAINERPLGDGTVKLGIKVAQDGTYTISAPRCQFESIILVDTETGIETDLANDGSYTFSASAGSNDGRFMLRMSGVAITAVQSVALPSQQTEQQTYNLNGQRIATPQKGLYIVNGKKVMVK